MTPSWSSIRAAFVLLYGLAAVGSSASAQITDAEFRQRRDSLTARLPQDAAIIAFGERDEIGFPAFYQSPNFRYLTGLSEPNAVLVITGRDASGHSIGTLFRQDRAPSDILFNGPLEDPAQVTRRTNLAVRPLAQLVPVVDSLIAAGRPLYIVRDTRPYGGTNDTLTRGSVFAAALRRRTPSPTIRSADNEILALRGRKSAAEEQLVRRSTAITSQSVNNAIRNIHPGLHEYDVQAMLEAGFRSGGGDSHPGFATNVSAGMNSTTAHHRAADAPLEAGKLVLMDVGAAYQGYSADVTRTAPVSGKFSPEQREIYQLVRDAQASAERAATLGAPGSAMGDSASATIARGLTRLGLIESPDATFDPPWADRCVRSAASCRQSYFFYFHGVGHGIGLDVHDATQYSGGRGGGAGIKPGDAFTIEPGIYIDARRIALLSDTPKNRAFITRMRAVIAKYDGIGVRIEDDYMATPRGVERITSAVREISEIEALMQPPRP
jgi:Xaa-Pro aminopeptidase